MLPPVIAGRGRIPVITGLVFIACLVWIILTRLHTADEPLDRDICTQILMGRVLADGGRLYVDTLEFKPPGMFVVWQVIHQLAGTRQQVVLWVNILATSVSLIGVFMAASARPWGHLSGRWAMVFWALISGDMTLQANQPNNEVFVNLFMVWGIAMWVRADATPFVRWRYAAAGLFLCCATLIKQVPTTVAGMACGWLMAGSWAPGRLRSRARIIGWVLLPIVVIWGLMVLYFAGSGRGIELYDCLVRYGIFYAESQGGLAKAYPPSIWLNLLLGLTDKLYLPSMVFLAPLTGLMIFGIVGAWLDGQRSQALTLAGCLFGTLLSVSIPGTYFAHYYQLYLPIVAVGAGWGIATAANFLQQRLLASGIGLAMVLLLLCHVVPDLRLGADEWSRTKYHGETFREIERCGQAADRMLATNESFYVWGDNPGVYYYSNRRPASGIFWADRLIWGPLKYQATRKVLDDLNKNLPSLILIEDALPPPPNHPVLQWINQRYFESPAARFSTLFTVYVLRNSVLASRLSTNPEPFALTLADVNPDFLKLSADELLQKGRSHEATAYLQKAVAINSSHPQIDNQLAWLLATSPEADLRNGPRAVLLAKQVCQLTDFKQAAYVATLAAAYAEAGQFDAAVLTAQKTCDLAAKSGDPELLKLNQERLDLYRSHQPYHESTNPAPTKPSADTLFNPAWH